MGKFYTSFQTCSTYGRGWFSSYSGNDTSFYKLKPSLALSSKWNMPGIQENWVEAEILCCRRPGKRSGTGDVKVLLLPPVSEISAGCVAWPISSLPTQMQPQKAPKRRGWPPAGTSSTWGLEFPMASKSWKNWKKKKKMTAWSLGPKEIISHRESVVLQYGAHLLQERWLRLQCVPFLGHSIDWESHWSTELCPQTTASTYQMSLPHDCYGSSTNVTRILLGVCREPETIA